MCSGLVLVRLLGLTGHPVAAGEPFSENIVSFALISPPDGSILFNVSSCNLGNGSDAGPESRAMVRSYLVSGKKKIQQRAVRPKIPVFSHQKFRQPTAAAIGPETMGPTFSY